MIPAMIKSALVLALAGIIASMFRRQSAAVRHAIWTAGLLGALAVPLLTMALPPLPLAWARRIGGPSFDAAATVAGYVGWIAITLWLVGASLGMALLFYSALRLGWVAIRSEPVNDARWMALAEEVRQSLGIRRPVRLLQNHTVPFLGTWGIFVPRVLLPANADGWSDVRIKMVLGHELAHIQRHDWVVQVLADAARAIYWFNPFFWIASRRLRQESEHACDDAVVRLGAAGHQYAEELLEITRTVQAHRLQSPILAMAQPSHLEQRLMALIDPKLSRVAATPWAVFVVALFAVGITLPLAAVRSPEVPPAPAANSVAAPIREPASPEIVAKPTLPELTPASVVIAPVAPASVATASALESATSTMSQPTESPAPSAPALPVRVDAAITADASTPSPVSPPATVAFECKVTTSSLRTKTSSLEKTALGNGPWVINDDRTIWVADQPYIANRVVTTVWMRPAGSALVVSARRLDGDAPALDVGPVEPYQTAYVAMGLTFPAAGCWEVTASAGDSTLTFITSVRD